MILVKVLIVLLLILIIIQIPKWFMRLLVYLRLRAREDLEDVDLEGFTEMEGFTDTTEKNGKSLYTDPGLNKDSLYMSTVNAANISYLKEQVDELSNLKQQVNTLKSQVEANTTGISALGEQMATASAELIGRDPNSKEPIPMATGLN